MNKLFPVLSSAFITLLFHAGRASAMARPNTDPSAPPPPAWVQWVPILVMLAVFYLLIIRPQSRQRAEHQKLIDNLKKGDRIVTQGGLIAVVTNVVSAGIIEVRLGEETKVQVRRSAVTEILPAAETAEGAAK